MTPVPEFPALLSSISPASPPPGALPRYLVLRGFPVTPLNASATRHPSVQHQPDAPEPSSVWVSGFLTNSGPVPTGHIHV